MDLTWNKTTELTEDRERDRWRSRVVPDVLLKHVDGLRSKVRFCNKLERIITF